MRATAKTPPIWTVFEVAAPGKAEVLAPGAPVPAAAPAPVPAAAPPAPVPAAAPPAPVVGVVPLTMGKGAALDEARAAVDAETTAVGVTVLALDDLTELEEATTLLEPDDEEEVEPVRENCWLWARMPPWLPVWVLTRLIW